MHTFQVFKAPPGRTRHNLGAFERDGELRVQTPPGLLLDSVQVGKYTVEPVKGAYATTKGEGGVIWIVNTTDVELTFHAIRDDYGS